jgi:hypothetical protein
MKRGNQFGLGFGGGLTLCDAYKTIYDSFIVKPSLRIANAQNIFVKTLVDAGIWATRDVIYVFAQNNSANALINWISPGTYNATLIGVPAFTAMEGFKGNATDVAIDTTFNASSGTHKIKSADVCIAIYLNEASSTTTHILFGAHDRFLWQKAGLVRIKESGGDTYTFNNTTGMFHFIRTSNIVKAVYDNGAAIGATAALDPAFENYTFHILNRNYTGSEAWSNAEVSYFAIGGKLTPEQVIIERNAFDLYLNTLKSDIIINSSVFLNSYKYVVEDVNSYTLSIRLKIKPTADVTVNISAENSLLDFSAASLTFTSVNYLTPQLVTINGNNNPANDQGISDENIILSLLSIDSRYGGITRTYPIGVGATELNITNYDPLPPADVNMLKYDVPGNYHFTTEASLTTLRQQLLNDIWIGGVPTKAIPDAIGVFTPDTYFNPSSDNLSSINKLTWEIPEGFTSYIYHCIPTISNNKCVFLPFGHGTTWTVVGTTFGNGLLITQLLNAGYHVFCGYMLVYGPNELVKSNDPNDHDFTAYEDPGVFNPLELFLDHWLYTLNYIKANFSFAEIEIMGHSGGGWTSVLMAACFADFNKCFEMAGTLPLFAKVAADHGDYEQGVVSQRPRDTFNICNFVDMYILASYNGLFCQIHNPTDNFFKALPKYHQLYESLIKNKLATFSKGEFIFEEYTYAGHMITQDCIDIIFDNL